MTATKERPILFTGEMVRAILAGKKTQTRRVIKPQPWYDTLCGGHWYWPTMTWRGISIGMPTIEKFRAAMLEQDVCMDHPYPRCPYGKPGERLWVKETITIEQDTMAMVYRADGSRIFRDGHPMYYPQGWPWQRSVLPSIFMPRWACRIMLEVTGVRVGRVQEISEGDAVAEGIESKEPKHVVSARYRFGQLWNSLNTKRGFGWDTNPWVWIVGFAIHDGERPRYE